MPLSQLLQRSSGELQAELQLILNAVVEGLCGVDAHGNATFCNEALLRMTGYRTEELIGNNLHTLVHHSRPDGTKYPEGECGLRKALDAGQEIHVSGESLWRKDGTCFPAEYWAHPLQQPSSLTVSVVTVQDITERERATEALRTSEEELRRILASMPDVAWTSDRERRTTYVSPKVEAVLGYTKQEFCAGTSLRSGLIHPEDFSRVNRGYQALFENQTVFDEEYRIRRKDGTWIWIHDRATGTHEENGILYADGVFSDVTRRKLAEAELQWKSVFLEAQANSTIDGILVVNSNAQILLHNHRFIELFQVPPELHATKEDRGLLGYVVSLIKDPEPFLAKVNYLYGHPTETSRDEIELRDGRVLDRYSAPVLDKEGKGYGRIWTFRDITERKRNEDTLQQLSMAVEQSPVAVVITDPRGDISYVNRRFTEWTGYSPEEAVGENPRMLKSGRTAPEVYRNLWATIRQGHEWRGEFCNKKKNGEIYWESAMIRPITDSKGAITHYLGVKEDITERRRAEKELRRSEAYLAEAQRLSHIGSWVWSAVKQEFVYWSEEHYRIFGMKPGKGTVPLAEARKRILPKDLPIFERILNELMVANRDYEEDFRTVLPDGSIRNLHSTGHPVVSEGGNLVEFVGTCMDVTERKRAEEALKTSEKRYRLLFERNMAGVCRTTLEGRVLECNQAAARMFGYDSAEEVIGLPITNLYYQPSDREVFVSKLKCEKILSNYELRFRRKNGDPFWVIANFSLAADDSAAGGIIEGTLIDITERKQAEEELKASEKRYRLLFERNLAGVFRTTLDGRILECNPAAAHLFGCDSPEELLTLPITKFYPTVADREVLLTKLKAEKSVTNHEMRIRRKNGEAAWAMLNLSLLEDDSGAGRIIEGTFVDITERKRAEKELRLTQSSLENASDAVVWIDTQARVVYANKATCRSLGRSREELLSLSIPDLDPEMPQEAWAPFLKGLKTQGSTTFETHHLTKQGHIFPVEITANYLEFDGQEYCVSFVRDITERRALESELRQAHKLEGIGQLASGIAHEINTPTQFVTDNLTFLRDSWKSTYALLEQYRRAIRNAAETLPEGVAAGLDEAERDCDLDFIAAEVPRAIEQGLDGAHRVAKIVRAMKEFSHPDSAEKTAADLNKAIESTITVARNEWKYVAEVVTEFDETLPAVVCYPGDINQVVLNLVVNAAHAIKEKVKEGEKGRITVGTRTRGEFAEISITDTGTGIPEAIRTRIFDPFFTTKEVGKGTGQGLSLAHAVVVKKHGGKIWFETKMGAGTTFFIDLPIKPADAAKET